MWGGGGGNFLILRGHLYDIPAYISVCTEEALKSGLLQFS
uniref:Uncharacterized protein n=1 Tax=Anguilla anguilla TaxID=7936 RepID=A0A0E9W197_ANGAN